MSAGHATAPPPGDLVTAPRKRRWAELALLVLALVVAVGAYAAIGLAHTGELPAELLTYGAGMTAMVGVTHLIIRFLAPYADPVLLPCAILLNGLGLALIHRLDLAELDGADEGESVLLHAPRQLAFAAVGVVLFVLVLVLVRDHRRLQRLTYTSGFVGVALLVLPLVPGLGYSFQGARIWIRLLGFNFQPGEVAKVCLIVFFAGYLVVKRDALALAGRRFLGLDLPRGRDLGPILLAWVVSLVILVFQRDLGSSLLFFGAFVVLLYVSTERFGWVVIGGLLFAGGALFSYTRFGHVQTRVEAWLDPFADPDVYYQIVQSLYGLAYGGILGQGLGEGRPHLVPVAHSDFIIATAGEELGVTGLMAIIVVYGLLVERGMRTALVCRDPFGKLLATGFAAVLGLQVFVVIGGVTKLIPLTGLTTPFLSYGGSSLIANWALVALLLRISDHARRPAPAAPLVSTIDDATQVVGRR